MSWFDHFGPAHVESKRFNGIRPALERLENRCLMSASLASSADGLLHPSAVVPMIIASTQRGFNGSVMMTAPKITISAPAQLGPPQTDEVFSGRGVIPHMNSPLPSPRVAGDKGAVLENINLINGENLHNENIRIRVLAIGATSVTVLAKRETHVRFPGNDDATRSFLVHGFKKLPPGAYFLAVSVTDHAGTINLVKSTTQFQVTAPVPNVTAAFADTGTRIAPSHKSGVISLRLENSGDGPAVGAYALTISARDGGLTDLGFPVDTVSKHIQVSKGQTEIVHVPFHVRKQLSMGNYYLSIDFTPINGSSSPINDVTSTEMFNL